MSLSSSFWLPSLPCNSSASWSSFISWSRWSKTTTTGKVVVLFGEVFELFLDEFFVGLQIFHAWF